MLKTVQKGFTLIELMIVVAIIGILAAIAIPAYQDYTIRAQVTEGMNLAAAVKAEVAEFYAQNGAWPTSMGPGAGTLDHAATEIPRGKYVDQVTLTNGTIFVRFESQGGYQANAKIDGLVLALRPRLSGADATGNEDVVWVCGKNAGPTVVHDPATASADNVAGTTLLSKYLPANCRA
jgi:type IV pilus assembly protein PilA